MNPSQRGVAAGMAGAVVVVLALTVWCTSGAPGLVLAVHAASLSQRLLVAVAAWIGPLVCLTVAIGAIANIRFFSAPDMDGAGLTTESQRLRIPRAVLVNTHEQASLAIPVYTALALLLPAQQLVFPLALSAAFVIGRIAFTFGYPKGAAARSFGFALTMYATVAGLVVVILKVLSVIRG